MSTALALPVAAALAAATTAAVRAAACRLGLVDPPDPFVPQHTRPVPSIGGVALALGAATALAVLQIPVPVAIVVGSLLFLAAGAADDVHPLPALGKLALQTASSCAPVALGLTMRLTGVGILDAGLAVVWILLIVNAVNLTDVCDGLVPGLAAVALLAFALLDPELRLLCLVAAGACCGFLLFNAPPASIFLGDAGSHALGFGLAALALRETERGAWPGLVSSTLVVGVFAFELLFLVTVRTRRGVAWWRGSADHFSLRLQAAGLSGRQTDAVAWAAAVMLAAAAWTLRQLNGLEAIPLLAGVAAALAASWRLLLRWDPPPAQRDPGALSQTVGAPTRR